MKLLKNIGLPKKFNDAENGYAVAIDEDPHLIYETHIFKTKLDFDSAINSLDSFISKHFGASKKTQNEISCVLKWHADRQEINAQMTNLDGYIGGYLNSKAAWAWAKT